MIGYIVDKYTLKAKDIVEVDSWTRHSDVDFKNVSVVRTVKEPVWNQDDWLLLGTYFNGVIGLVDKVSADSNGNYSIQVKQPETLFDKLIIDEYAQTYMLEGIGTWLAQVISDHYTNNRDTYSRITYLNAIVSTNPTYPLALTSDGMLNILEAIRTFIREGYCLVNMSYSASNINFELAPVPASALEMNLEEPDIASYTDTTATDMIGSLTYLWKMTDTSEYSGAYTQPSFYWLSNGTISTNPSASGRIHGKDVFKPLTAPDYASVQAQAAIDLAQNNFAHKLQLNILRNGLRDVSAYVPGRRVNLRWGSETFKTYISSVEDNSDLATISVTLGDLPLTLTDKLRRR